MAHESELPGKYGHPIQHDPEFSGPLKHRSCTDVLCLLLFIVFIGCWIGVGLYAFKNGDPSAILIPRDSNGLRCGVDIKGKPYLYFFDLTECIGPSVPFWGCPTPQVCVEECPNYSYGPTSYINRDQFICREGVSDKEKKPDGIVCAKWCLPSTPIQKRCIPVLTEQAENDFKKFAQGDLVKTVQQFKIFTETEQVGQNIVNDLVESWQKILIGLLLALAITLIYILMLRWTAGVMVWVSIIGVIVALSFGTYGSWMNYKRILNQEKEMNTAGASSDFRKYFWLTALIVCSVALAVLLLITIFLRKRISLAIALIEEGSKAISSVISVFVFPMFPWVLHLVVAAFFIAVALLLSTTGSPLFLYQSIGNNQPSCANKVGKECDPTTTKTEECQNLTCTLSAMKHNRYYNYMHGVNIVGFFWGSFFASAFGQMVLASVFATWYWTKPRSKLSFFAVTSSTLRVMRYHIGTLAFGSLIITICRMIRLVLDYIDRKLKKYDNELSRAIMCLFKCFFWCLEKFLKFINTNAYIMCAIHGKNFCTSAKEAFMLLMRNILRVFVLDKVTDFLFFVSSLLISIGVGVLAYFYFTMDASASDNSNLNYVEVPIVVIVVCTYFITKIFFSVYSMAVDTLFLCFLEDCERNDGSSDRPYYMSKDLMKIFGKKNKEE